MWRIYKRLAEQQGGNNSLTLNTSKSKETKLETTSDLEQNSFFDTEIAAPLETTSVQSDFFDESFKPSETSLLTDNKDSENKALSSKEILEERLRIIGDIVNKSKGLTHEEGVTTPQEEVFEANEDNDELLDNNKAELEDFSSFEEINDQGSDAVKSTSFEALSNKEPLQIQEEVDEESTAESEDLSKFDILNEGEKIVEGTTDEFDKDSKASEDSIIATESTADTSNSVIDIDIQRVANVFAFLQDEYDSSFIAGVVYDVESGDTIYNYKITNDQIDFFKSLNAELSDAALRSNFNRTRGCFVLDLEQSTAIIGLEAKKHQIVLVFNQNEVDLGYIHSVVKPYVIREYNNALGIPRPNYDI